LRREDSYPLILDIAAADANGQANGLTRQNFTVLIDKKPVAISDFHSVTPQTEPADLAEVLFVVDELHTSFSILSYERGQIRSFLERNVGKLNHPVRLAFLSQGGCAIQAEASRDANAVLAAFDQHSRDAIAFHDSFTGGVTHGTIISTLRKIATEEAQKPGRKIVVWIGSGWPIFNRVGGVELSARERHGIFNSVISISTALRKARITLYCVNSGGAASFSTYYEEFLKPVTTASDAEEGDVNLQVLAVQSGGLVLKASNDVSSMLQHCIAEADSFYILTVVAPLTGPEKFHKIEVKVNTTGIQVRTRNGYYG
jgi:VWFA-related protein